MSEARRCDRCKEFYVNGSDEYSIETVKFKRLMDINTRRYDLCPSCAKSFAEWFDFEANATEEVEEEDETLQIPMWYKCPICKVSFKDNDDDVDIVVTEKNRTLYECPNCGHLIEKREKEEKDKPLMVEDLLITCKQCCTVYGSFSAEQVSFVDFASDTHAEFYKIGYKCPKCGKINIPNKKEDK